MKAPFIHQPSRTRSLVLAVLLLIGGVATLSDLAEARHDQSPDMAELAAGTMMCAGYLHQSLTVLDDDVAHHRVTGYVNVLVKLGRLFGEEVGVPEYDLEHAADLGQTRARRWQERDPRRFRDEFDACVAFGKIAEDEWLDMQSRPQRPAIEMTPVY